MWKRPGVTAGVLVGLLSGCTGSDVLFEDPSTLSRNWIIRDVSEGPRKGPSDRDIRDGQRSSVYRGSGISVL